MIRHAMAYVTMAQKVRAELADEAFNYGPALREVEAELVAAEQQLVVAYGKWRVLMRVAADGGSKLAAEYVERTVWDLT